LLGKFLSLFLAAAEERSAYLTRDKLLGVDPLDEEVINFVERQKSSRTRP